MKVAQGCVAVAALMLFAGASGAQELLTNGGLDSPGAGLVIDDWTIDYFKTFTGPSTDGVTLEPWADRLGDAGEFGAFFKAFQGNNTTGDLANVSITQDVAATAGVAYTLSGWARGEDNYSGLIPSTATETLLAIDFDDDGDATNGVLSTVVTDLVAAGLNNDWLQYDVSGVAPAGTTVVRARVAMLNAYNNPDGGGQAFIVDDLSLTGVPEPAALGLLALGIVAGLSGRRRAA